MTHQTEEADVTIDKQVRPILRFGIAGLLLVPGVSKFVTYGTSVRFFDSLGFPSPGSLVLVVGALELMAAALLLLDERPRIAALIALPIMAVAIATAGPSWQNVAVLTGAVALLGLDTPGVCLPR